MPDLFANHHHEELPPDLAALDHRLMQAGTEWATAVPWTGAMEHRLDALIASSQTKQTHQKVTEMDDTDNTSPRPPFISRPVARWSVVSITGVLLAIVLVVTLNTLFLHHTAATTTSVGTASKPIYLTWADQDGNTLGARNGANGRLLWRVKIADESVVNGAPLGLTLADGTLYLYGALFGQANGQDVGPTVTAIRASDGHPLWHQTLAGATNDPYIAPVVAQGMVFATQVDAFSNSTIIALRASDGHVLWRYPAGMRVNRLQMRDDTLYMGENIETGDQLTMQVEAVNAMDGTRIWHTVPLEGSVADSFMLGSTSLLVTATQYIAPTIGSPGPALTEVGYLHVINLATGQRLWHVAGGNGIEATFDAASTTVFATETFMAQGIAPQSTFPPSRIVVFDAKTGVLRWQHVTDGAPSAPVVTSDLVYVTCALDTGYFPTNASTITAWDVSTGTPRWHMSNSLPSKRGSIGSGYSPLIPPQVLNGAIYTFLLSSKGTTLAVAFDARTGQQRWSMDMDAIGQLGNRGPRVLGTLGQMLVTPTIIYVVAGFTQATTAIRASDGKRLWTFATPQNSASLIVGG